MSKRPSVQVPPANLDAERAVLGAVLLEGRETLPRVVEVLRLSDFFTETHRVIYGAMLRLFDRGEPVDLITLSEELRHANQLEFVGGPVALALLVEFASIAVHVGRYANIVRSYGIKRDALALAVKLAAAAQNGGGALPAILGEVDGLRARAARRRPDEAPSELNALLAHRFPPWPDVVGRGLLPREGLLVVGGAPKVGKSLLLDNLCLARACGRPWLGFPTDPGITLIVQSELRAPAVAERFRVMLKDAPEPVPEGRLHIKTRRGILLDTPEGLAQIMAWIEESGADLVRIDPLARHMAGDENSNRDMGALVQTVDTLIECYAVAVIIAHHPSKPTKDQPRTGGDRLRGAGALFAAADTVIMMDRTEDGFTLSFDLRHAAAPDPMRVTRAEDLWLVPVGPGPELLAMGALVARAPLPYNTLRGAAQADLGLTRATATRRISAGITSKVLVKAADGLYIAGPAYLAAGSRAHEGSSDA